MKKNVHISKSVLLRRQCLSPSEIDLYRKGQLTGEDLRSVEFHLSECPLCSDAVDGFFSDEKNISAEVIWRKLTENQPKHDKKPILVRLFTLGNVAALLLITLTASFIYLFSNEQDLTTAETAFQIEKQAESPSAAAPANENPAPVLQDAETQNNVKPTSRVFEEKNETLNGENAEKAKSETFGADIAVANESPSEESSKFAEEATIISKEENAKTEAFDEESVISEEYDDAPLKESKRADNNAGMKKRENKAATFKEVQRLIDEKQTKDARRIFDEIRKKQPYGEEKFLQNWTEAQLFFLEKKLKKSRTLLQEIKTGNNQFTKQADSLLLLIEKQGK